MSIKLSPLLTDIVRAMESPIAKKLIVEPVPNAKIDYLDSAEGSMISYLDSDIASVACTPWIHDKRKKAKFSTILNKLFNKSLDENELRSFIEEFKAKINDSAFTLEIGSGQTVVDVYNIPKPDCSVYTKSGTRLHGACFQGNMTKTAGDMFIKNPDKINILYVLHNGKLDGRALIFHGNNVDTNTPQSFLTNLQYSNEVSKFKIFDYCKKENIVFYNNRWLLNGKTFKGRLVCKLEKCTTMDYLDNANINKNTMEVSLYA